MAAAGDNSTLTRLSSEEGFTLVELLIAMALGIVVLTTAAFVFTAGIRLQPRIDKRAT